MLHKLINSLPLFLSFKTKLKIQIVMRITQLLFIFLLFFGQSTYSQKESGPSAVQRIVIDAGHGGTDPGNLGTGRLKTTEKDVNLNVALQLGTYIKTYLKDVEVHYTRTKDTYPELPDRARLANNLKADLFISIHCDAFKKRSVQGCTSLVLGDGHHEKNRIAIQENGLLIAQEGKEKVMEHISSDRDSRYGTMLYKDKNLEQSISLASKIQSQFKHRVSRVDRGVKHQNLYVIRAVSMPSVLVELGFLTNPEEERFLNSNQGQEYMASAIFRAFRAYKKEQDSFFNEVQFNDFEDVNPELIETPPLTGTYYCVQLLASANKLKTFNDLTPVEVYKEGNLYKYLYGQAYSMAAAKKLKAKARKNGYPEAFIVGMKEGRKVSKKELRI
ncbi:MAG: N-acetylmuramoyl-L-alanine amidase family protein [Flavobacteriales bacterium]